MIPDDPVCLGNRNLEFLSDFNARHAFFESFYNFCIPGSMFLEDRRNTVFGAQLMHGLPAYFEKLSNRMVGNVFLLQFNQLAFADFCHDTKLLSNENLMDR